MKYLWLALLILILTIPQNSIAKTDCGDADANTWCAELSDDTIDGDTFCGDPSGACTSSDTVILLGGTRGDTTIQDFDGDGSYITITNQDVNPDSKVVIDQDGSHTWPLKISNCKYVDFRGNNDNDLSYGIYVNHDYDKVVQNAVQFTDDCDNIKFSYVEIDFDGNGSSVYGAGLAVATASESNSVIYDTFEIHHNYIHDTRTMAMYIGRNRPATEDDPYIANFSVHDNLLEDIGAYGITLKGVNSSSTYVNIYNNTIKVTGLVSGSSGDEWHGIGVQDFYGSTYANIYNNWIEKTRGPGFKIGYDDHQIYNNVIAGCGTENETEYGHGIYVYNTADGVDMYDNVIVDPTRYGIYADSNASYVNIMSRNIICGAGQGEWYQEGSDLFESLTPDNNIYDADCANIGFPTWSDDSDYSNDDFGSWKYGLTLSGGSPTSQQPCDGASSTDTISVTSSENANCRQSVKGADTCVTLYENLDTAFTTGQETTAHSFSSTTNCGATTIYVIKCEDYPGATDVSECLEITHDVAAAAGVPPQPAPGLIIGGGTIGIVGDGSLLIH